MCRIFHLKSSQNKSKENIRCFVVLKQLAGSWGVSVLYLHSNKEKRNIYSSCKARACCAGVPGSSPVAGPTCGDLCLSLQQ